ncbi:lipocalin family protein [Bacteroides sp.]|uniref:lipocalin family protein n=1 Tax=Bacteroides sp. TaxID=29523 RepID=UPI00260F0406|nr:lipocalin family protein [Bacteroides sp.]
MKTQNLFSMLMLVFMAFSFISCADEDNTVEISQLEGLWFVKEPVLEDDYVTSYTFKADKTCEIYTGSPLSNGIPLYRTYQISNDKKLVTIFDKEGHYTEQYHILKLTSDEMKWENASPKDGNSDKRLEKYKD